MNKKWDSDLFVFCFFDQFVYLNNGNFPLSYLLRFFFRIFLSIWFLFEQIVFIIKSIKYRVYFYGFFVNIYTIQGERNTKKKQQNRKFYICIISKLELIKQWIYQLWFIRLGICVYFWLIVAFVFASSFWFSLLFLAQFVFSFFLFFIRSIYLSNEICVFVKWCTFAFNRSIDNKQKTFLFLEKKNYLRE